MTGLNASVLGKIVLGGKLCDLAAKYGLYTIVQAITCNAFMESSFDFAVSD